MKVSKVLNIFFLIIFFTSAVTVSILTFRSGHNLVGGIIILVTVISAYIFLTPSALPLRFMYPGLITFLIFTILPICYTIYISTTNLSTEHFFSKKTVINLLMETKTTDESSAMNYFLTKSGDNYRIFVSKDEELFWGVLSSQSQKEVKLNNIKFSPNDFIAIQNRALSRGEVFRIARDLNLREINFLINGETFTYLSNSQLAKIKNRYVQIDKDTIYDHTTDKNYIADDKVGEFVSKDGDTITPGYTVKVGLSNFITLFTSAALKSSFFKVFRWTIVWAFTSVLLSFTVGLFLALLLNDKKLRGRAIYRILLIIPYAIPFFISVLVFRGLLNQDFGIINHFIELMGLSQIPWLNHATWAKVSCLIVNLWLSFPYMFLLITGILQSIPESIYEAAKIEGAGPFFVLRRITLPLIFSSVGPLLIGSFAFNLNNFVSIYLLTSGGPPIPGATTPVGETDILLSYTYRMAFEGGGYGQNYGLASSISILIFVIIAIITLINFKLTGMMKERPL